MANKPQGRSHQLLQILLYPLNWLEERTSLPGRSGIVGGIKYFLFRKVPSDISWGHTLGSAALTAFIVQAVTGVILAMYYKPDPNSAYESIRHITDDLWPADRLAKRRRNAIVDHRRNRAERSGIERARREER